jgi:hypothetical protein
MYSALFKSAHIRDPIPILRFRLEVRHEGVMVPAVLLSAYISHLAISIWTSTHVRLVLYVILLAYAVLPRLNGSVPYTTVALSPSRPSYLHR